MRRITTILPFGLATLLWIGAPDSPDPTLHRSSAKYEAEPSPGFGVASPMAPQAGPATTLRPKPVSDPVTPTADWLASAERWIAASEYEASVNPRGLQAPNRAQNLRTYFEPGGIRLTDRTAAGAPELARIRLHAFGREGALAEAGESRVSHERSRVELARPGLVEWYENSPAGLEQGFTLEARPAGEGLLVLELRVDGASVSLAGGQATLACAGDAGRRLRYAKLAAFDANGAPLEARLEACDDGLRIVTDDRDAAYPVTIDPLIFATSDTQLGVFQGTAQLGRGVASAGDVNGDGYGDVLIGTEFYDSGHVNEGAAFLFLGGPNGIQSNGAPSATFQPNQDGASMGRGMAAGDFNGDGFSDLALSAYNYSLGQTAEGVVFLFPGGPFGMADGTPATASDTLQSNSTGSLFGVSLACAGDVNGDGYEDLLVGSRGYNGFGAAFLFAGGPSGIASAAATGATTRLLSVQAASNFGAEVAGAGDVNGDGYSDILIGAYYYDLGQTNEGAAFVYLGGASGIAHGGPGTANGTLQCDTPGNQFGTAVAGLGDVNGDGYSDIGVSEPGYNNGHVSEGAVWVFHGGSGGIVNRTTAGANNRIEGDQINALLGSNGELAGAGDVNGDGYADLIVGADRYDSGQTDEGAAFVFVGGPTGIVGASAQHSYALLQKDQPSSGMGSSVAGAGDVNGDGYSDVIVGAYRWDAAAADEGAGFLYLGGARGMRSAATTLGALASYQPEQELPSGLGAMLGQSVASAGDVNGDGYADIIVGSPGYDLGEMDEGAAFIFLGGAFVNGTPASASTTLQGNTADLLFGYSAAGAGDVNGDGFADVIVGAPGFEDSTGAAYVFLGGATGVANGDPASAASVLNSDLGDAQMGCSVAGAGDVDGDGFADVIVGAETFGGGGGGAFVYRGSHTGVANGNTSTAASRLLAGSTWRLGHSVAGAGDVNADGYADVVVGAPYQSNGQFEEGVAHLYLGGASGIESPPIGLSDATFESNEPGSHMGMSVAGAGDVNGDGYGDLIVGCDRYGQTDTGAAFVWFGGASGIASGSPASASMTFTGSLANGMLGSSVACAGDLNGDGLADLIVGAIDAINFLGQGALANVYMGTRTPGPATPPFATLAGNIGGRFGTSVAGAGDVDGDGFADVIVGAPLYLGGRAFVYGGGGGAPGRPQLVRQLAGGPAGSAVPPWGTSLAPDQFRVAAATLSAAGRRRVKLQVEHCPVGVPFGSPTCTRTTSAGWTDTGANPGGVPITELLTSVPTGLTRWRARTLFAPLHVTEPGITEPYNPPHGPWRRLEAQRGEADLRVTASTLGVEVRHDPSRFAIERLVNPTRDRIEFSVVLPGGESARVELFDVAGRRHLSRELPARSAGRAEFRWDGRHLPSGVYLLRVSQGGRSSTARLVLNH